MQRGKKMMMIIDNADGDDARYRHLFITRAALRVLGWYSSTDTVTGMQLSSRRRTHDVCVGAIRLDEPRVRTFARHDEVL